MAAGSLMSENLRKHKPFTDCMRRASLHDNENTFGAYIFAATRESVTVSHVERIELSVVAYQDDGIWIAQCVEYDIAASASTLPALERAFERAVAANLCVNHDLGRNALDGIPPAPSDFKAMFDDAALDVTPRTRVAGTPRVPRAHFRVAEGARAA